MGVVFGQCNAPYSSYSIFEAIGKEFAHYSRWNGLFVIVTTQLSAFQLQSIVVVPFLSHYTFFLANFRTCSHPEYV